MGQERKYVETYKWGRVAGYLVGTKFMPAYIARISTNQGFKIVPFVLSNWIHYDAPFTNESTQRLNIERIEILKPTPQFTEPSRRIEWEGVEANYFDLMLPAGASFKIHYRETDTQGIIELLQNGYVMNMRFIDDPHRKGHRTIDYPEAFV